MERAIHATSSRSRCRAREEKGASYALSASARPAGGASREAEGGGGNTHSRWRGMGRARTRYGVAQDGEKKGLFDGGGRKKTKSAFSVAAATASSGPRDNDNVWSSGRRGLPLFVSEEERRGSRDNSERRER